MSNFDEYKRHKDPEVRERAENWAIAIGLQKMDGLTPTDYLFELARKNIVGEMTMAEVKERLKKYHAKNATVTKQNATVKIENATVKLSATQQALLELFCGNGRLTAEEIANDIGKEIGTIKRAIKVLRDKGLLTRIGSDKAGVWKVLKGGGGHE